VASDLCDVNLWLALVFERHPHHAAAVRWWSARGSAANAVFCRVTQSAFLRISTGRAFLAALAVSRRTNTEAWDAYDLIQRDRRVSFAREPADIESVWKRLSRRGSQSTNLWTDAYLAAFAITADYRFVTFDRDFRRFETDGLNLELLER
jgi:toxin-antitoxin system PIN domain toxin